ncbi:MAG TPA: hypothetical protein VNN07_05350 [Candidatus Tectomicrobia bacterium]|nr:hypothetical protein [Candidatus Tectomicrobia bacterium]
MTIARLLGAAVLGAGLTVAPTGEVGMPGSDREGFGAHTPGGAGQPVYRVTSLGDGGPGTLRQALSEGYRDIRFDVAGTIELASRLHVQGPFVTVDGTTAPPPGITLRGAGLAIRGTRRGPGGGAHDIIVRGLRVRQAIDGRSADCVEISHGASNIVLERVSTSTCSDGSIDITHGAHDVTVAWSIVSNDEKTMLIGYGAHRVTVHHTLFAGGRTRNPYVTCSGTEPGSGDACAGFTARTTTVDFRNNVVWGWADHGMRVRDGAWANVVGNLFASPDTRPEARARALVVCRGDGVEAPETLNRCRDGGPRVRARVFAGGNVSLDGVDVDAQATAPAPFPAPAVTTTSACEAAHVVAAQAGVRPLDDTDRSLVAALALSGCRRSSS